MPRMELGMGACRCV